MRLIALASLAALALLAGCGSDDPEPLADSTAADSRAPLSEKAPAPGSDDSELPDSPAPPAPLSQKAPPPLSQAAPEAARAILRECGYSTNGQPDELRDCLGADIPPKSRNDVRATLDDCQNNPRACSRNQEDFPVLPAGMKPCDPANHPGRECGLTGLTALLMCGDKFKASYGLAGIAGEGGSGDSKGQYIRVIGGDEPGERCRL